MLTPAANKRVLVTPNIILFIGLIVLMIYNCFVVLCRAFRHTTGVSPVPAGMFGTKLQHPPPHRRRTVSVESSERKLFFPNRKRMDGEVHKECGCVYDVMFVLFSIFDCRVLIQFQPFDVVFNFIV